MAQTSRFPYPLPAIILLSTALTGCGWLTPHNEAFFLKRGHDLLAAKDYSRALLEFKNAARAAPADGEPYYQAGLTHLYSGDYRSALASFHKCLELAPGHSEARLKTAQLMTSSAKPETLTKAVAQLHDLLELSPQNADAAEALAFAEWRLGNHEKAIERLDKTLRDSPAKLSSAVMLARMKLGRNDLQGAEEILRQASDSAPQSTDAALALGEMYLVTGQVAKAESEILRAIRLNARNGQALMALAAIQTGTKRLDAAEETYGRISALEDKQYKPLHALFLVQRGKQEQGVAELRKLAARAPSDRALRTHLIAALLETGKGAEAEQLLAGVLKRNSKDTDALMQRSALYLREGRAVEAQRDLQQVLQVQPDSAEAHRFMARTFKSQGQWQNERLELIESLKLRQDLLQARLGLARNYINANEPKVALQVLNEAPEQQRKQLPFLIERNWALLAANDLASLRTSLDSALQNRRDKVLIVQLALAQMANKDYPAARSSAEEILKSDPQDMRAIRIITESYLMQNQPKVALNRLSQLAKLSPQSAALRHMLGLGQLSAGNQAEARKEFEAAKIADAGFSAADIALADMDRRQNRAVDAVTRLEAVIAREPYNVAAKLLLAEIEKSSGNHAGAIEHYRAVLAIDPSNLVALNNISTELTPDRPDEALGFAQHAFDLAPDNAAVKDTLGWIYYRKGVYPTAAQYLKEAVAKEPNPRRQFHLGMSYIKAGDLLEGRKLLQAAIRQDPSLSTNLQQ